MQEPDLTSSDFWEDPGHFVAGSWEGDLAVLGVGGPSVLFKTSGSTGTAKWIAIEKRALLASAHAVNEWLGVSADSVWGLALPCDHVGGFAIPARVFDARCEMETFSGKWDAGRLTEWLDGKRVTHTSLVPTQLHDLVAASSKAPDCLEVVVVGGGRLAGELGQAARDLGWPVLASYGMTEAGSQIATQHPDALGGAFSASPIRVLPIWEVETGGDDLLSISGEALFSGTVVGEGAGARFEPRAPGAFLTSDRVVLEGDAMRPLGRADSLVKVLGVLVDLEALEDSLRGIGGGRMAGKKMAIIALPDERREHVLAAVFEGGAAEELVVAHNQRAGGVERIERIFSIPEFPRSSLGKLQRERLMRICAEM